MIVLLAMAVLSGFVVLAPVAMAYLVFRGTARPAEAVSPVADAEVVPTGSVTA